MTTDDAPGWDARYHDARVTGQTTWSPTPNAWVEATVAGLAPGSALDLGAGEGRHALWLAGRGWRVTAVDYSAEGIETGRSRAGLLDVDWVVGDARTWRPSRLYDLVLLAYLHIPHADLARVIGDVPLARGGTLAVIGHDETNTVGGPSDASILLSPDRLRDAAAGLEIVTADRIERSTPNGVALDTVLVARRSA